MVNEASGKCVEHRAREKIGWKKLDAHLATTNFSGRQTCYRCGKPEPVNLVAANVNLRKLACTSQQYEEVINFGRIYGPESLFRKGSIYGYGLKMLVDTGASRTIVRPDTVTVWEVRQPEEVSINYGHEKVYRGPRRMLSGTKARRRNIWTSCR